MATVTDQQITALAERLAATERAEGHEGSARTWEGVAKRAQRGGVPPTAAGTVIGTWVVVGKRPNAGGWYRVECTTCGHPTTLTPGSARARACAACTGSRRTPAQLKAALVAAEERARAKAERAEHWARKRAERDAAFVPPPPPVREVSDLRRKIDLAYEPAPLPEGLAAALDDATRRADRLRAQLCALDVIREVAAELAARGAAE